MQTRSTRICGGYSPHWSDCLRSPSLAIVFPTLRYLFMRPFSKLLGFIYFIVLMTTVSAQFVPAPKSRRPPKKDEVEKEIKLGEDEAGCKDSELIPRIPGCNII